MPVEFHIFAQRNLVLARFTGHILTVDSLSSARAYAKHPNARPGQNQLIDLSGVVSYERNFVRLMAMMAQLPDYLLPTGANPLIVYLAPTPVSQKIANILMKSMAGITGVSASVVAHEEHALEILGQPEHSMAALMANT